MSLPVHAPACWWQRICFTLPCRLDVILLEYFFNFRSYYHTPTHHSNRINDLAQASDHFIHLEQVLWWAKGKLNTEMEEREEEGERKWAISLQSATRQEQDIL